MATTRSATKNASSAVAAGVYAHAPSTFTLFWLAVSLPLVIWDCGYVLLRPRTMEGGDLHWPLWTPYKLYGEIDHVYGWKAFNAGSGFTAAQGFLNVLETVMYLYYFLVYYQNGVSVAGTKKVLGRKAAVAVLVAFSAAVMTLSKTVLYCRFPGVFRCAVHRRLYDQGLRMSAQKNAAWLTTVNPQGFVSITRVSTTLATTASRTWFSYGLSLSKPPYPFPPFSYCKDKRPGLVVVSRTSGANFYFHSGAWLIGPTVMIFEIGGELVDNLAAGVGSKRD